IERRMAHGSRLGSASLAGVSDLLEFHARRSEMGKRPVASGAGPGMRTDETPWPEEQEEPPGRCTTGNLGARVVAAGPIQEQRRTPAEDLEDRDDREDHEDRDDRED